MHQAIRKRYTEVASSAVSKFAYPTGRAGAVGLGYDVDVIDTIPAASLAAFCGVGNPWRLGLPGGLRMASLDARLAMTR
jgi:hypothetical protein